jgi:hypothetical protein
MGMPVIDLLMFVVLEDEVALMNSTDGGESIVLE